MNVCLEVTDVGKRYRGTWALRHCSLALSMGSIAALVGQIGRAHV